MRGAVINHLLPSGKFRAVPFVAPRSDDLQVGRERGGGQLETDLIVALAGRTVRDGVGFFLLRDLDHALGDERARNGRTQEVLAFVNRAGAEHWKDEVARKLFLQIINVDFGRAGLDGFGFKAVEFLLLPDVGAEADHFGIIFFLDPGHQDGSIEAAGIS